ncbi:Vegetative incompatibility protein HET-E-1, partial [Durusdinium trenchii]
VTCTGAGGGEVDAEQVGLVVVCASQRLVDAVNGRQGEIWTQWSALVVRKQLPFVVVVVETEASQDHWTGGFALQAGRAAAVVGLTGEEKGIVEDAVAQIVHHVEPEEDDQQGGKDDVVLFALDGSDPLQVAREKSALYVEGTRAWALDEFRAWANRSASVWASDRVLVFVGPAGFGKSVLMARICDENGLLDDDDGADEASSPARKKKRRSIPLLSMLGGKKTQEQTVVKVRAAHFFKHDDQQACDLKTCLLSMANQLAAVLPAYREEIAKLDKNEILHGLGPAVLFDRLIAEPMSKVPEPSERVVVLLDALDEVTEADRGVLLHIVRNLWHTKTPEWLGLVLSTRPEDPIRDTLEVFRPTVLQLDDERNLADLRHFLETRLRRHLAHVDRDLERAVEILAERAEGLFLYAYFVDQTLVGRESKVASLEELEEVFPDGGIDDMYQSYFSRLLEGPLHGDQGLYSVLLGTLVAARSPVPRDVLQVAVRMESFGEFDEILARSEQLLAVGTGTVRFIHKSMSDFVQHRRRAGSRLVVDADVGHQELARVVVDAPAFARSSPFLLRHALFHLAQAHEAHAITSWLLDFRNVHQALRHADPTELVSDASAGMVFDSIASDVVRVLELGAEALRGDADELAGQLVGRVPEDHPVRASLEESWLPEKQWLMPVSPEALFSTNAPLVKVLHASYPGGLGTGLAMSNDGALLAEVNGLLWDVRRGVLRHKFDAHRIALSGDGSTVLGLVGQRCGAAFHVVWDATSLEELRRYKVTSDVSPGHAGLHVGLSFNGSVALNRATSHLRGPSIQVYDSMKGILLFETPWITGPPLLSQDGSTLMSGSSLFKVATESRQSVLSERWFTASSISACGNVVVGLGRLPLHSVMCWKAETAQELTLAAGEGAFSPVVTPSGDIVAFASRDGTLRTFLTSSGEVCWVLQDLPLATATEVPIAISGDGLLVAMEDPRLNVGKRDLFVWASNPQGRVVEGSQCFSGDLQSSDVSLSKTGRVLVVTSRSQGSVRVMLTDDVAVASSFRVPSSEKLVTTTISPDGSWLLTCTDVELVVWEVGPSATLTKAASRPMTGLRFSMSTMSSHGTTVAIVEGQHAVKLPSFVALWNTDTDEVFHAFTVDYGLCSVAVSEDGKWIAMLLLSHMEGHRDPRAIIRIRDIETGQEKSRLLPENCTYCGAEHRHEGLIRFHETSVEYHLPCGTVWRCDVESWSRLEEERLFRVSGARFECPGTTGFTFDFALGKLGSDFDVQGGTIAAVGAFGRLSVVTTEFPRGQEIRASSIQRRGSG